MWSLRFVALIVGVGLLLPLPVRAAPPRQDIACDLAASLPSGATNLPFVGRYLRRIEPRDVTLADGVTLHLRMCAPEEESGTAQRMLNTLADALPRLSRYAGPRYNGSAERKIVIVTSPDELPPYADASVDGDGIMHLRPTSDEWAVVHEGAHFWANRRAFAETWLIEGYAEYLTGLVAPELRIPDINRSIVSDCRRIALEDWTYDPEATRTCGYSAGRAVFRDLERALGPEQLQAALRDATAHAPASSRALLDTLENTSGMDLAPLFQQRVFSASETPLLERRKALRGDWSTINGMAEALGVDLPPEFGQAMAGWNFDGAERIKSRLLPLLQQADALRARCAGLGLTCPAIWQPLPDDLDDLRARLSGAQTLINRYGRLADTARTLRLDIPAGLVSAVAALQADAPPLLDAAASSLDGGARIERRCTTLGAPCGDEWRARWSQGDFDGANRAGAALNALLDEAERREGACGELKDGCRAAWQQALRTGGPAGAHTELQALGGLLARARPILDTCGGLRDACRTTLGAALRAGGSAAANTALNDLEALLQAAASLEPQCAARGWPCAQGWRETFRQSGTAAAREQLARMEQALPTLPALPAEEPQQNALLARIDRWLGLDPAARNGAARVAFDGGDVAEADRLARSAQNARFYAPIVHGAALVLALALLLGSLAGLWREYRRRTRRKAPPADLLADLLRQPPGRKP